MRGIRNHWRVRPNILRHRMMRGSFGGCFLYGIGLRRGSCKGRLIDRTLGALLSFVQEPFFYTEQIKGENHYDGWNWRQMFFISQVELEASLDTIHLFIKIFHFMCCYWNFNWYHYFRTINKVELCVNLNFVCVARTTPKRFSNSSTHFPPKL